VSTIRREVGFWPTLFNFRLGELLLQPEFFSSVIVGVGGGVGLLLITERTARVTTASDFLAIIGALLGVVFAAFALVISLFSDSYLKWLNKAPQGVRGFLAPFMFTIGLQVGTILLVVGYRATALEVPPKVEKPAWVFLCFAFTYSMLNIVALARAVLGHGITRARAAEIGEPDSPVRPFQQRGR